MDYCCGLTMVGRLQNVYTEGSVLIQDVPILFCPTCQHSVIAPDIELDYQMYVHHCETDGVRSGRLSDVVSDEKLLAVLEQYPEDERIRTGQRVIPEQIDTVLDLLNYAQSINDHEWGNELRNRLLLFGELRDVKRV